jgi:hypothetical protein
MTTKVFGADGKTLESVIGWTDDTGAWYKTEKRFIKMAGAYLRGRRWEDEGGVTEVAEHREPDPVQLTAEEERIIADIYASGGGWG